MDPRKLAQKHKALKDAFYNRFIDPTKVSKICIYEILEETFEVSFPEGKRRKIGIIASIDGDKPRGYLVAPQKLLEITEKLMPLREQGKLACLEKGEIKETQIDPKAIEEAKRTFLKRTSEKGYLRRER